MSAAAARSSACADRVASTMTTQINPLADKAAPQSSLVNVAKLVTAYTPHGVLDGLAKPGLPANTAHHHQCRVSPTGLSAACKSMVFFKHRSAAGKRYSLG